LLDELQFMTAAGHIRPAAQPETPGDDADDTDEGTDDADQREEAGGGL
jgi:hypothetical protein